MRVKSIIITFAWAVMLFFAGCTLCHYPAAAAGKSSCIQCHTNEQTLKTLHKPSKIEVSEGEG